MALPTMVIASYVATSRLHENVHYLSDVLMGSAVGVASGWTVVGRHGRSSFAITPAPVRGGLALQIARVNR
jgi:membrane-associated phospholipid phosphatase